MKKFVLTVLAIAMAASPAFAQTGDISGYADGAGTGCNIVDNQPFAFIDVFFLHKSTAGGTAAQFTVVAPAALTYINSTEAPGMLRLGDANVDMSIAYGGCLVGDFLIVTVRYLGNGSTPACAQILMTAAPTSPIPGEVAMVDCGSPANLLVPGTGVATVNPDGTCQCDIAVEEKTWGAVKALYR